MPTNFITLPPDSSGKKLQTWDNTINNQDVHAEAMVVVDSGGNEKATAGNPVRIDPTGTTSQPVTGIVLAKLQDGLGNTITSDVRGTERPLSVQVLDASGNQIVNFGGSGGNAAAGTTGSAVPGSADYQGVNVAGTLRGQTGVNPTGSVYAAQIDATSVAGTSLGATAIVNYGSTPAAVAVPAVNAFITNTPAVTLTSTTVTNTVAENLSQVAGTSLGATAVVNYGSTPAAVAVPAVNAFITNTPAVTLASTTVTNTVAENLTQVASTALGATAVVNYGSTPAAVAVPAVNAFVTNTVAVSGTVTSNQGGAPWTVKPDNSAWTLTGTSANVDVTNTVAVSGTLAVTQSTTPWVDNISQFGGNNIATGTGLSGAGIPRVTVSSDSFPTNSVGDLRVDASLTPISIRDSVGEDLYGTNNNLNVHLAGNEIFNLDGSGNLGVNIQSGAVTVAGTVPVSLASTPLPVGAALETGNLATIATLERNAPQITDLLAQILAQLQVLNMNFSAYSSFVGAGTIDDVDAATNTLIVQ